MNTQKLGSGVAAVTGAGGYVGQNLVRHLLDKGYEVRALDCVIPPRKDERASWQHIDVLNRETLDPALNGVDVVFHLAAKITLAQEDPLAWEINTEGVRNVAEAALACGVQRMVHTSSMASFDLFKWGECLNESSPRACDPTLPVYGRSKLAGEEVFLSVVERGLDGVVCYPTTLFGPDDRGPSLSQINAVILAATRGRVPVLLQGGIDLVDVRDVCEGLMLAAAAGRTGECYLIGGNFAPMMDVFKYAASLVGRVGPLFALPLPLVRKVAPLVTYFSRQENHPLSKYALDNVELSPHIDYSKASTEFGYRARPMEETLADLVAHFVKEGHLRDADHQSRAV